MNSIPVPPDQIYERYRRVAEMVAEEERKAATLIPTDEPYGLDNPIKDCVTDWETERKSVRTVPVVNAYGTTLEGEISPEIVDALVGLDVTINALDDIIDTDAPSKEMKIKYTSNVAFATTLTHRNVPPTVREAFTRHLCRYYVQLFQIPLVENELVSKMESADSSTKKVEFAVECYKYRSRVMNAFARLPALAHGVPNGGNIPDEVMDQIEEDLRTYRARDLLFKDIQDIQRDHKDSDRTPVLARLLNSKNPDSVATFVEQVADNLEYSTDDDIPHVKVLQTLENRPGSINTQLSNNLVAIDQG